LQEKEGVAVAAWWLCRLPIVELVFVVVCRLVCWYSRRRRQLWKRCREKERKTERVAETGKKLIFWLISDSIFSSLRP